MLLTVPAAQAEIISISTVALDLRCPCSPGGEDPLLEKGVLKPSAQSKFYASVSFPTNGQRVCSFSLVYHDVNANNAITARLFRKAFAHNTSNAFNPPTLMAVVNSAAGVSNLARKATTTAIASGVIAKQNSFYYVEVTFPTINMNVLGVQIDVRPTCP